MSGLSNIRYWLQEHGHDPQDKALCDAVFALAKRSDHTLTREEIEDEIAAWAENAGPAPSGGKNA